MMLVFRGTVALGQCLGFTDVLAVFGPAVPACPSVMIDLAVGVHPNQPGRSSRSHGGSGFRADGRTSAVLTGRNTPRQCAGDEPDEPNKPAHGLAFQDRLLRSWSRPAKLGGSTHIVRSAPVISKVLLSTGSSRMVYAMARSDGLTKCPSLNQTQSDWTSTTDLRMC